MLGAQAKQFVIFYRIRTLNNRSSFVMSSLEYWCSWC